MKYDMGNCTKPPKKIYIYTTVINLKLKYDFDMLYTLYSSVAYAEISFNDA